MTKREPGTGNSKPFISFIIPVYNVKDEYLEKCIESLMAQDSKEFAVILVDDGSVERVKHLCDAYSDKYENITIIHQENQGVSAAHNNGMKMVQTPYLAFVDADDWVEEVYIDSIKDVVANSLADADVIMFNYTREFNNRTQFDRLNVDAGILGEDAIFNIRQAMYYKHIKKGHFNPYSVIAVWNKIYKTEFIKKNAFEFSGKLTRGEDRIFNADILFTTEKIYHLDKSLYHYRCWSSSTVNAYNERIVDQVIEELEGLIKITRKHDMLDEARQGIDYRICTRLYSCMRLYYFHPSCPLKYRQGVAEIKRIICMPIFQHALDNIDYKKLNWQEKLFVTCIKLHAFRALHILVNMKNSDTRRKILK